MHQLWQWSGGLYIGEGGLRRRLARRVRPADVQYALAFQVFGGLADSLISNVYSSRVNRQLVMFDVAFNDDSVFASSRSADAAERASLPMTSQWRPNSALALRHNSLPSCICPLWLYTLIYLTALATALAKQLGSLQLVCDPVTRRFFLFCFCAVSKKK